MTTADQLAIVNKLLADGEHASTIAQASLVVDWSKSKVVLVLVRCESCKEDAVMVMTCASFPVVSDQDVKISTAIPVDQTFKFEIESGPNSLPDGVYVNISSNRQKYLFEMLPGYHTQNFVSELYRVTDGLASKIPTSNSAFSWLEKYKSSDTPVSGEVTNSSVVDTVSDIMSGMDMASPGSGAMVSARDREGVVSCQLSTMEDQFTKVKRFTCLVGTYNVNGKSPDSHLKSWLASDQEPPDIYAIGFQELDLSTEAFVFAESIKEEEWTEKVRESLHPGAKYQLVKSIRLVGMMLLIWTREEHVEYVTNISADTVGNGIMGKLGNKGGVGVSLRFHASELCFVNSHLAAHQDQYERRNQDYHSICSRMTFSQYEKISNDYPPMYGYKRIKDFDSVIWLGDLNYRLNDLDIGEVKEMLKEDNLELLMESDQLQQQQQQRRAFTEFTEGKIKFIPTYKYDIGTNDWDSSEKNRAPAWTDRILWRGSNIYQTNYRGHQDLMISDHKPVSARFNLDIKVIDRAKRHKIKEEIMKKLDFYENTFLPQVTVDQTEVVFENVKFLEPITKIIAIANTGQVPAQFEFIPRPDMSTYSQPWLVAEPSSGLIMVGEKCDVSIQVYVDKRTAHTLNSGKDKLYDILVLHLNGGRDIFITVEGTYQRSCFGCSISALVQLTVPLAELNPGQIVSLENGDTEKLPPEMTDGKNEAYPVPKELWFLCDLLTTLGLDREHLFLHPGLRTEILQVRDWLDTGHPIGSHPQVSIHSAAETLMIFLESLREPVIPYSMYSRCLELSSNFLQCKQLVSQLPVHHKHVFEYLTAFLREVTSHSAKNGIDTRILATLFCNIFLRDPPNTNLGVGLRAKTNQQLLDKKKATFLHHFITNLADD